jgi:hypothetical protein
MKELNFPLALIGIALVILLGVGVYTAGVAGAVITTFLLLLQALVSIGLGIVSCFVVAAVLGTSFGALKSACVKLAAVALFPLAIGILIGLISPIVGFWAVLVLYVGLLQSLFDLEIFELFALVFVLWGVATASEQLTSQLLTI